MTRKSIFALMLLFSTLHLFALKDHYWIVQGRWSELTKSIVVDTRSYNSNPLIKATYVPDRGIYHWSSSSMSSEEVAAYPHSPLSDSAILGEFKYYYKRDRSEGVCFIDNDIFVVISIIYFEGALYSFNISVSSGTELSMIMDILDGFGLLEDSENHCEQYLNTIFGVISQ